MTRRSSLASYAKTRVTPGQSREKIEGLLTKIGVDLFRWTTVADAERIEFRWPRPDGGPIAYRLEICFDGPAKRAQMLRVLFWYLKSKIEAIDHGLVDVEQEFLPHMLMPSGQTVYQAVEESGMEQLVGPNMIALPPGRDDARS